MPDQPTSSALPDCNSDPVGSLKLMFIDKTMGPRIAAGQCPVRRAVFLKPHGVAKADFIIMPGLPAEMKLGIFSFDKFEAWVRFSSDTVPGEADQNLTTTVGVGIKLFGVPGKKLLEGDEDANTADFLLQNAPVFFVDNVKEMCEFTRDFKNFVAAHPTTARILADMEKNAKAVTSCLKTTYWSGLPYSFGNRLVKYQLVPIDPPFTPPPSQNNANFLAEDLQARLNMGEAQFQFMVQFSTNPDSMPADKATVEWDEQLSPPVHVATLVIRKQDVSKQGQAAYGENLSFNPWRTLKEHQPQGSIGDARRVVYKAGADLRRFKNGVPATEPTQPR